jgi:hypothetical protein
MTAEKAYRQVTLFGQLVKRIRLDDRRLVFVRGKFPFQNDGVVRYHGEAGVRSGAAASSVVEGEREYWRK